MSAFYNIIMYCIIACWSKIAQAHAAKQPTSYRASAVDTHTAEHTCTSSYAIDKLLIRQVSVALLWTSSNKHPRPQRALHEGGSSHMMQYTCTCRTLYVRETHGWEEPEKTPKLLSWARYVCRQCLELLGHPPRTDPYPKCTHMYSITQCYILIQDTISLQWEWGTLSGSVMSEPVTLHVPHTSSGSLMKISVHIWRINCTLSY